VLILPFTPVNKNNMLAWMAARCDSENYGRIIEYKFPKEKLVYGPLQIESRIDQDSEISELFTLWGQRGSSVIRGNLLVIPVKDSLIYVEPIYLRAEQSELPELKRVIIGYRDNIEIGVTLEEALYKTFGRAEIILPAGEEGAVPRREEPGIPSSIEDLIKEAGRYFNDAQERLKQGDFAGYGDSIQKLGTTLGELEEQAQ